MQSVFYKVRFFPRGCQATRADFVDPQEASTFGIDDGEDLMVSQMDEKALRNHHSKMRIQAGIDSRRNESLKMQFKPPFTEENLKKMAQEVLQECSNMILKSSLSKDKVQLKLLLEQYERNVEEIEGMEKIMSEFGEHWVNKIQMLKFAYYNCLRDLAMVM